MSIPLLLWLLYTEILLLLDVMHCAPKIGGILFEPILFEAFESDEKATTTTTTEKETTLSESTVNITMINEITGSFNETVAEVNALRADADMEYLEEEEIITSTPSSTTAPKKTTTFIAELNIETVYITLNTTSSSPNVNQSTTEQNATSRTTQTTKKVMLYELLTPDKSKMYGRARYETTTNNLILNFLGYNFDDTICRIVDQRVLCGYDKNPQLVQPVQTVEVGNDCRLRGDRIECGYVNPPFDGIRRPPGARPNSNNRNGNSIRSTKENLKLPLSVSSQKLNTTPKPSTSAITTAKATSKSNTILKTVSTSPSTTKASPTSTAERTTIQRQEHCVEKGDRIVCYDIKN